METELIDFLNEVMDNVEVPRRLRLWALELKSSINSEPQIEAQSVKENEQTKEVYPLCQSDDTFSIELVHTKCRSCSCQWTN